MKNTISAVALLTSLSAISAAEQMGGTIICGGGFISPSIMNADGGRIDTPNLKIRDFYRSQYSDDWSMLTIETRLLDNILGTIPDSNVKKVILQFKATVAQQEEIKKHFASHGVRDVEFQ